MAHHDIYYCTVNVSEMGKIDWSAIIQEQPYQDEFGAEIDYLRYNNDSTKFVIKWEGDTPAFVKNLTTATTPMLLHDFIIVLQDAEWQDPDLL